MPTTFSVLYLGTATQIDTTEGNVLSENASALVGLSFGSAASPLAYNAQATLSPVNYAGGTPDMYDIDNTVANDTFSIDGGAAQTFDGLAIYNATISYTDGTPDASVTAVLIQDTAGNVYWVPESSANADHTAMTAAPIESITLDSLFPISSGRMIANRQDPTFVCYAPGTRILTDQGEIPVERLRPGDRVVTLDHGPQPIRWVRSAAQPLDVVRADQKPVLIRAGALGGQRPGRDLVVSPQHRILVGGRDQLPGAFPQEALAPAKALTALRGVRHMAGKNAITWVHFACDRHEIVRANGCWSEALLLGPVAQNALTPAERVILRGIYARAADPDYLNGSPARPLLPVGVARRGLTGKGANLSSGRSRPALSSVRGVAVAA